MSSCRVKKGPGRRPQSAKRQRFAELRSRDIQVWADGERLQDSTNRPDIHVGFSLARGGEGIVLSAPDGSLIDSVVFGAQYANQSQGRFPDGSDTIVNQIRPSPNSANIGGDVPPRLNCSAISRGATPISSTSMYGQT